MKGPKGREGQNKKPHSLTIEGLKKHWDLIPLFGVMTIAMSGVVLYVGRLSIFNLFIRSMSIILFVRKNWMYSE